MVDLCGEDIFKLEMLKIKKSYSGTQPCNIVIVVARYSPVYIVTAAIKLDSLHGVYN